jgi:hypothetical protein
MGAPTFDERDWPIVRVTYPHHMSENEAADYYQRLRECLKRKRRFALLMDARQAELPTAAERAQITEFWRATAEESARLLVGIAVVMKTALGRAVVTALCWAYTPPFAIRSFGTLFEGEHWLRDRLALHASDEPRPRH